MGQLGSLSVVPHCATRYDVPPFDKVYFGRDFEVKPLSLDPSLKGANALIRHRNVLTRAERLDVLKEEEKWTDAKSVFGLPKVAHRKATVAKAAKEEVAEGAAAGTPGAVAAPAAGAAAAAPGKGAAGAVAKGGAGAKGAAAPAAAAGKAPAAGKAAAPAGKKK